MSDIFNRRLKAEYEGSVWGSLELLYLGMGEEEGSLENSNVIFYFILFDIVVSELLCSKLLLSDVPIYVVQTL